MHCRNPTSPWDPNRCGTAASHTLLRRQLCRIFQHFPPASEGPAVPLMDIFSPKKCQRPRSRKSRQAVGTNESCSEARSVVPCAAKTRHSKFCRTEVLKSTGSCATSASEKPGRRLRPAERLCFAQALKAPQTPRPSLRLDRDGLGASRSLWQPRHHVPVKVSQVPVLHWNSIEKNSTSQGIVVPEDKLPEITKTSMQADCKR